jgi:hypothetical protein
MQFQGGYRYPSYLILTMCSVLFVSVAVFIWYWKSLSLGKGVALLLSLQGTILWASSLTPIGLKPPPAGFLPKLRWFFEQQGGVPFSVNQPLFYIGVFCVLAAIIFGICAD